MGLNRYNLGELLSLVEDKNTALAYGIDDVRGISIKKTFIETKADMEGVSLRQYLVVKPTFFCYVTVTSRNGEKISLAYNDSNDTYIASSSYVAFRVKRLDLLNPKYLFMYFNRPEFDRFSRFTSWGSARETFSWEDLSDIEIDLPDIPTQQKYVDIYEAMVENQKAYETGLDDLKLTCDAYIEKLRRDMPCERIGKFLSEYDERNDSQFGLDYVKGITTQKEFIDTKADMNGVSLSNYKIVKPNTFAYVSDTSRRGDKVSLAFNSTGQTFLVSSITTTMQVINDTLLPAYLFLFFKRTEFDRFARFNSWGSARETLDWDSLCSLCIPIPKVEVQQEIVDISNSYFARQSINEKLKTQIKDMCPILIKGSIEEGRK